MANGGGRAATRGVANARRGGLEEGRPQLDFIHVVAPSWPRVRFCEVSLVPLVVLPGELWFLLVAVHDRRVGRGAHRVRPGGEDAVVGPPVVGLVVKVVAEEIDWHAPLERDPKGGKRRGEPKAELSLELVLEGVGGEGGGVRTVDTDIEGLAGERR